MIKVILKAKNDYDLLTSEYVQVERLVLEDKPIGDGDLITLPRIKLSVDKVNTIKTSNKMLSSRTRNRKNSLRIIHLNDEE